MKSIFLHITYLLVLLTTTSVYSQKNSDKLSHEQRVKINRMFYEAQRLRIINDPVAALDLFTQITQLDTENDAAYYEMGNLLFNMQKKEACLDAYSKATEINPNNEWYQRALADAYLLNSKNKEAIKTYDALLKVKPNDPDVYFEKAMLLMKMNEYSDAIKAFENLEKKIGLLPEIVQQKQIAYLKLGKVDKAAEEIERLINEYPNEVGYKGILANLYEANNMPEKALAIYNSILQTNPNDGHAHYAIANIAKNKGELTSYKSHIIKAFEDKSFDIDTKVFHLVPYINALINKEPNGSAMAKELSEVLVKTHPENAKANAIMGDVLFQEKKDEEALVYYKKSANADNTTLQVWTQILIIESQKNDTKLLLEDAEKALSLYPNSVLVNYFAGMAALQQAEYKKAKTSLENAVMLGTENNQLLTEIHAKLGELYQQTKEYKKSDANFEKALLLDPNNIYVKNNFAYYLSLRQEQLDKALALSKSTLDAEPNSANYLDTYGWILFQLKKYDEAKNYLLKAIDNGASKSPEVLEHLGDTYSMLGDTENALVYWNKAKNAGRNTESLLKKIADKKLSQ